MRMSGSSSLPTAFSRDSEIALVLVVVLVLVLEGSVLAGWLSSILRMPPCLQSRLSVRPAEEQRLRGQPARRSLPEFQAMGRSREADDEYEYERDAPPTFPV
jgi:hypothetical protein